jgi:hypothetical protein
VTSLNRYQRHLLVLPEDDANRQIATGFKQSLSLNDRVIQVLKPAGGWGKVLAQLQNEHIPELNRFPEERLILLIDFDNNTNRLALFEQHIPDTLGEGVFVIGALSEPEELRRQLEMSFEQIGEALADHCAENNPELWNHDLLRHNNAEIGRMAGSVKSFLFN